MRIALTLLLAVGCSGSVASVDAGPDVACAADFGVCHADLEGACFVTIYRATGERVQACSVSFAVCEPARRDAMIAAGCAPD